MNYHSNIVKKFISVIATFALLFNSLATPYAVLAQELPTTSPEPTPTADVILGTVSTTVINDVDLSSVSGTIGSVSTNQADYSPTDVVLISGSGFTADKTYTIEITSNDDPAVDFTDNVTADSSGNISYAYQLDGNYRPNYSLQIKDGEVVVASATFTDGSLQFVETGLPGGTNWSVTWNGNTGSSTTNTVAFGGSASSSFAYSVPTVLGYTPTPSSGNASRPATGNTQVLITFSAPADHTPPVVTISSPTSGSTTGTAGTILYSTDDAVSAICTLDGAPYACTISGSVGFSGLSNSSHTFAIDAPDSAGNHGTASVTWNVDAIGPTVSITSPTTGEITTPTTTATYTTGDATSVSCKLDGSLTSCNLSGAVLLSGLSGGSHTFTVQGTDSYGNLGNIASVTWSVIFDQTITFAALAGKTYGDSDFGVSATASSSLPVTFTATGNCSVTGSTVHITGAGSCTVTAHQVGNAFYNAAPDVSRTFSIAKADAVCSVIGYSDTYDGNAHGATGSCTGVAGDGTLGGLDLGDSFTNVPGGTAHWVFTGGDNYNNQSGNVAIEITKANADVSVTEYSVIYDGDAHTATGSATGVKGEALSGLDLTHTTHTNAGDYSTDYWAFTDVTGNYNDVGHTIIEDQIAKTDPIISVTPYSVDYDSHFHTATGSATGVKGETLSGLDLSATTHKSAGDYLTDPWSFTDVTGNYNDKNDTVHDQIGKVTLTVTADNQTKQYSDPSDSLTFQYSGFVPGENSSNLTTEPSCTTTRTTGSAAGTYPITCSGGGADNYSFSYVNGTFTVTKENTAITYNGSIFASTAGPLISYAPISLSAHLTQESDGNFGDLTLAKVNFILAPASGPAITVSNVSVNSSGDALTTYNVPVGNYTVTAVINPTNLYWTTSQDGEALLTVAPGILSQTVTGGGWISDRNSANGKDNFGFTVQYNKNSAPKGNFLYMWRGTDGFDYQLKSNSWANGGLSFDQTNGAYFTAKATLSKIDRVTGIVISSDGSYKFAVNITDGDLLTPKVADTFAITIFDSNNNVWKQVGPSTLGGGNVVVHSK